MQEVKIEVYVAKVRLNHVLLFMEINLIYRQFVFRKYNLVFINKFVRFFFVNCY